jgi:HSP20 family protein
MPFNKTGGHMNYSDRQKEEKKKREQMPTISDWFNEPLSTAVDFFGRPIESFGRPFKEWWNGVSPTVDVSESEKEVFVRAEVPGMDEKELNINYSQGILTIEGEKKSEVEYSKGQSKIHESKFGSFRREIPLGNDLLWDSAKANYKNGVLKIVIPKSEKTIQSKKINIE